MGLPVDRKRKVRLVRELEEMFEEMFDHINTEGNDSSYRNAVDVLHTTVSRISVISDDAADDKELLKGE
jgi:hypothetical protein